MVVKNFWPRVLTGLEKKWHPECFVCCECSEKIVASFGVKNGRCKSCQSKSAPNANAGKDMRKV